MPYPTYNFEAVLAFYGENPVLFWKAVSMHFPLSAAQIRLYQEHLYIGWLSHNTQVKWTPELIADLGESLDWKEVSMNPAVVWTPDLLEQYADKVDWGYLPFNEALPLSKEMLDRFQDRMNKQALAFHPALTNELAAQLGVEKKQRKKPPVEQKFLRDFIRENRRDEFAADFDPDLPIEDVPVEVLKREEANLWLGRILECESLPFSLDYFEAVGRDSSILHRNPGFWKALFEPYLTDESLQTVVEKHFRKRGMNWYELSAMRQDEIGLAPKMNYRSLNVPGLEQEFFPSEEFGADPGLIEAEFDDSLHGPLRLLPLIDRSRIVGTGLVASEAFYTFLSRFSLPEHRVYSLELRPGQKQKKKFGIEVYRYKIIHFLSHGLAKILDYGSPLLDFGVYEFGIYQKGKQPTGEQLPEIRSYADLLEAEARLKDRFDKIYSPIYVSDQEYDLITRGFQVLISVDLKAAIHEAGFESVDLRKEKDFDIVMKGAETEQHRQKIKQIVAEWLENSPQAGQEKNPEWEQQVSRRDRLIGARGLVEAHYAAHPPDLGQAGQAILLPVETALDVIFPSWYKELFGHASLANRIDPKGQFRPLALDEIRPADFEKYVPQAVKAVAIAEDGLGDMIGFMLKPDSDIELDGQMWLFRHETAQVQKW